MLVTPKYCHPYPASASRRKSCNISVYNLFKSKTHKLPFCVSSSICITRTWSTGANTRSDIFTTSSFTSSLLFVNDENGNLTVTFTSSLSKTEYYTNVTKVKKWLFNTAEVQKHTWPITAGHSNMGMLTESCCCSCFLCPFDLQLMVGKQYRI